MDISRRWHDDYPTGRLRTLHVQGDYTMMRIIAGTLAVIAWLALCTLSVAWRRGSNGTYE